MATEEYFSKSLSFRLRKVARYVRIYGLSRTLVKVRSQYHMRSKSGFAGSVWDNELCRDLNSSARTVGLIGCGSFAYSTIAHYLFKEDRRFLVGAMDTKKERARSLVARFGGGYATSDADVVLHDPRVRLLYVASNHASHAEYAIEAIRLGKNVHIEKPHVVSRDQLSRLEDAMKRYPDAKVFLGFNRPRSRLFKALQSALERESGPTMINWFVAGHAIDDDHWYFKPEEGGRILGNLCHWTDLTMELVAPEMRFPCRVIPASPRGARSDFVTSFEFNDGSLASITFSAKGHTFEGVREILNVHKGDVLAEIRDFERLTITKGPRKKTTRLLFRDHGHQANVLHSYFESTTKAPQSHRERKHLVDTAQVFLAAKESHDEGLAVVVSGRE